MSADDTPYLGNLDTMPAPEAPWDVTLGATRRGLTTDGVTLWTLPGLPLATRLEERHRANGGPPHTPEAWRLAEARRWHGRPSRHRRELSAGEIAELADALTA